jgi:hypothetical protein
MLLLRRFLKDERGASMIMVIGGSVYAVVEKILKG